MGLSFVCTYQKESGEVSCLELCFHPSPLDRANFVTPQKKHISACWRRWMYFFVIYAKKIHHLWHRMTLQPVNSQVLFSKLFRNKTCYLSRPTPFQQTSPVISSQCIVCCALVDRFIDSVACGSRCFCSEYWRVFHVLCQENRQWNDTKQGVTSPCVFTFVWWNPRCRQVYYLWSQ